MITESKKCACFLRDVSLMQTTMSEKGHGQSNKIYDRAIQVFRKIQYIHIHIYIYVYLQSLGEPAIQVIAYHCFDTTEMPRIATVDYNLSNFGKFVTNIIELQTRRLFLEIEAPEQRACVCTRACRHII